MKQVEILVFNSVEFCYKKKRSSYFKEALFLKIIEESEGVTIFKSIKVGIISTIEIVEETEKRVITMKKTEVNGKERMW